MASNVRKLFLLCKSASNGMVIPSKSTPLFAIDEEEYNVIYVSLHPV
jgi:hypothetical protein